MAAAVACLLPVGALAGLVTSTKTSLLPRSTVIDALSCPSADLCVGEGGALVHPNVLDSTMYSTHPSVGSSWKDLPSPPAPGATGFIGLQITCPSSGLCIDVAGPAVGDNPHGAQVFAIHNLDQPSPQWQLVGGGAGRDAQANLSCPTAGFCAELAANQPSQPGHTVAGRFWVSTDPGTPGSWRERQFPGGSGLLVCPSSRVCLAGEQTAVNVVRLVLIRDPLNAASRWHPYNLTPLRRGQYAQSVGCTGSGACVMLAATLGGPGSLLATSNLEAGASGWHPSYTHRGLSFGPVAKVSCFPSGTCYTTATIDNAGHESRELLISANPFDGSDSSWQAVPAAGNETCATPSLCFASIEEKPLHLNDPKTAIVTTSLTH